jgi:hypothetical protein
MIMVNVGRANIVERVSADLAHPSDLVEPCNLLSFGHSMTLLQLFAPLLLVLPRLLEDFRILIPTLLAVCEDALTVLVVPSQLVGGVGFTVLRGRALFPLVGVSAGFTIRGAAVLDAFATVKLVKRFYSLAHSADLAWLLFRVQPLSP